MGLRDAFSKPGGGGRLNNVAGTITEFEFSSTFPYESKNGKTKKKSDFESLWLNMSIRVDGAEEAVVEPIFAGDASQWDVSEDGHSVSPKEGCERTPQMFGSAVRLLGSMIDKGFAEPEYDADNGTIDLSTLLNQRFTFVQVVDVEATSKFGKVPDKKDPKKTYDRKALEVSEYHGDGDGDGDAQAEPVKGKAAVKGKKAADVDDDTVYADGVLVGILKAAKGNEVDKSALSNLVTRKLLGNPKRNAIHKLITSAAYQAREAGWTDGAKTLELA